MSPREGLLVEILSALVVAEDKTQNPAKRALLVRSALNDLLHGAAPFGHCCSGLLVKARCTGTLR